MDHLPEWLYGGADSAVLVDRDFRIVDITPSGASLLAQAPVDLVGRPLGRWVAGSDLEGTQRWLDALATSGPPARAAHLCAVSRPDGAAVPVELSAWTGPPDGPNRVLFVRDASFATERERLAAIVESSDDAIIGKTLDGVIRSWNAGAERVFGYTAKEAVGQSIHLIIPPERAAEEAQIIERLRRGERVDHFETRRRRKCGDEFPISLTISPIRDSNGRIVGASKIGRDISERSRMEAQLAEEARTMELLQQSGQMLAASLDVATLMQSVTDLTTRLAEAQFGAFFYNTRDADGESFALFALSGAPRESFERFGPPRATPLFKPTFDGQASVRVEDVLTDPRYGQWAPHHGMPKGHLPVRSYLAVPVVSRSGHVIGGLFFGHAQPGVFTPRTQRLVEAIAAQAATALDNAELYEAAQKATAARGRSLEAERLARAEAERQSVLKDEFLATLSHELRTPLSAIVGWIDVLRRSAPTADLLMRGLSTIERNARVQTQLIEDLLDMSRITSGKLRLDIQPVRPIRVIEAAIESLRPAADSKGLRIETFLDPSAGPLSGDPGRLQQVFWNLLSNAIKFTPRGGKVQVYLECVNSHIEVSVVDTGQGIEPDFLPHVFERFRQRDSSTTRHHAGLGLGLSIVRQLVELHGGTVRVKSGGIDHGATFTVFLPLAVLHREPAPEREHPRAGGERIAYGAQDLAGVRILVVDDEPDGRELMEVALGGCGATVITAESGATALDTLARLRVDVLISDIGMPGMDGYELLKRIRSRPALRDLPAIALTAFARAEDRTRALRTGFQSHIAKPAETGELVATISSVLGRWSY